MRAFITLCTESSEHEPADPLVLAPRPILGSHKDTYKIELIDIELADV